MPKHYSKEIANAVLLCLNEENLDFEYREEDGSFYFRIGLPGKIKILPYVIRIHSTGFTVRGLIPIGSIPDDTDRMQQMNDFVNRANDCLTDGNFEFDCSACELRYKVHVNCRGLSAPTNDMILSSICCVAAMCERYGEGFGKIIFAEMSAENAIALCEQYDRRSPFEEDDDIPDDLTDAAAEAEDDVFDTFFDEADDDIVLEIVDNEKDPFAVTPAGNGPALPQFGTFNDDEDVSDILRKLREMREDD